MKLLRILFLPVLCIVIIHRTAEASPTWSTEVHDLMISQAFASESWQCLIQLQRGSQDADKPTYQQHGYSHMHAMREKGQKIPDAVRNLWNYVDRKFAEVRMLERDHRLEDACYMRGMALHPIMDSTSPAHRHYAEWDPLEFKDILSPSVIPAKVSDLVRHGDVDGWIKKHLGLSLPVDISEENLRVIQAQPELLNLTVNMMKLIDFLERQP